MPQLWFSLNPAESKELNRAVQDAIEQADTSALETFFEDRTCLKRPLSWGCTGYDRTAASPSGETAVRSDCAKLYLESYDYTEIWGNPKEELLRGLWVGST